MRTYILKRLLLAVPTIFGVVTLVFFSMHLAPGDPVSLFLPPDLPGAASAELVAEISARYGFDQPVYVQYFNYLQRTARLDFGRSLRQRTDIASDIKRRTRNTLELGLVSLFVSGVVGIGSGVLAAVRRGSWIDNATMFGALFGIAMPNFFMALMLILIFGLWWPIVPPSGFGGSLFTPEGAKFAILPVITLGLSGAGIFARYTRSSMLEIINRDYVRTARAKGLRNNVVIVRHALRNALIPIITLFGLSFGSILSGTVIVETVFGWPGLGRYLVNGITGRDFPVVQATVLVIAIGFVLANLIADILIAYVDPRIRFD
jgi:peptide/nickel transport system permease protein